MSIENAAKAIRTETGASSARYRGRAGVYDEMVDRDGRPRPAWQGCYDWFTTADAALQSDYAQKIERHVFEHFFDPQRGRQTWRLDLMPLILDAAAWSQIETAAIQRARLYNALLADLYGPQTTMIGGFLPAGLILNDTSFLRPLHNVCPTGGHLTFLALDFARDPAGNWRIIDVHTETPAGHGFALANRMVMSEVAGGLFRRTGALRVGPFYQSLMNDLTRRAKVDDPLIAVLAPRPSQSAFIGHSYLARYMGQKRVEGSDLRVVGNRVYLKTIDGLKKIDLLVRAVEGHRADPLELDSDGFDGPVGLVEACRQSPDIMVNALGTAVVENRGLSGYLFGLSQTLLGEDLVLADAPRLWLGDAAARKEVASNFDDYVIYSAQEGTGSPGEAAPGRRVKDLSPDERIALETDIRFNGARLVAEKPIGFATAPAWRPAGLAPEPYAVRVYVSAIGGEYAVMPGGLALSVDSETSVTLTSMAARSRDVWVVSEDRVLPNISLARIAAENARVQRQAPPLQSRAADNMFWLGRYCERADGTLRVIRQALHRSAADLMALSASRRPVKALHSLLTTGLPQSGEDRLAAAEAERDSLVAALNDLCASADKLQGLPKTFEAIRGIALECRDRLSEDSWRILTGLSAHGLACHLPAADADGGDQPANGSLPNAIDIIDASEDLIDRLAAFNGMSHENMTRNAGWTFLDLGRRIERAHQLATLLLSLFSSRDDAELEGDDMIFALQAADSFITFRSRYRFAPELHLVLDLLIIDETNPRSLAYQFSRLSNHIADLPKSADDAMRAPDQRLALELLTKVRLADVAALAKPDDGGNRDALCLLLEELIRELPRLSEHVSRQYFSLADEEPHRLHLNSPR